MKSCQILMVCHTVVIVGHEMRILKIHYLLLITSLSLKRLSSSHIANWDTVSKAKFSIPFKTSPVFLSWVTRSNYKAKTSHKLLTDLENIFPCYFTSEGCIFSFIRFSLH